MTEPPRPAEAPAPLLVDRIVETVAFLYIEGRRQIRDAARKHALTGTQLAVLKHLVDGGELSLTALAEELGAQNSTVTGVVDRMEAAGLLRRSRSATDRRVVIVRLTPQGRALARAVPFDPRQPLRRAVAVLSPREQRALLRILAKIESEVRDTIATGKDPA